MAIKYRYDDTLRIYHFTTQNAVLTIRFPNAADNQQPTITIYTFAETATVAGINRWINNQHSDALYADVPQPLTELIAEESTFSIISSQGSGIAVENDGFEYDKTTIEFYVGTVSNEGIFYMNSFTDSAVVFYRQPAHIAEERLLDITSKQTQITTIIPLTEDVHYGRTARYYHFKNYNAVLKLILTRDHGRVGVPEDTQLFLGPATINLFSSAIKEQSIKNWIANELNSNAVLPVQPNFVYRVNGADRSVLSAEHTDTIYLTKLLPSAAKIYTGHNEYKVSYTFASISETSQFKLIGFTDQAVAYVLVDRMYGDPAPPPAPAPATR